MCPSFQKEKKFDRPSKPCMYFQFDTYKQYNPSTLTMKHMFLEIKADMEISSGTFTWWIIGIIQ